MSNFDTLAAERTAPEKDDIFGVVLKAIDNAGRIHLTMLHNTGCHVNNVSNIALGQIFHNKAVGRQHHNSDQPARLDSTFRGFSLTKLLTTISSLQCVERGLINLDDAVGGILPELEDSRIVLKDKGKLVYKAASTKITLRQLLTHSSGIGSDSMSATLKAWRDSRGEGVLSMSGNIFKAYSLPLLFEPGQGFAYGGSMDWAGVVVERLSGKSLGKYMQDNIFDPLAMDSSTFHLEDRPDVKLRLMQFTCRDRQGKLQPDLCPYPDEPDTESGGMGIVTSMDDFLNVLGDLLREEPLLLRRRTVDEMFRPQFPLDGAYARDLQEYKLLYENITGGVDRLSQVTWGLGGMLVVETIPNHLPGTLIWGGRPNLGWCINREQGFAALYGSQMVPASDLNSARFMGEFMKEMWRLAKLKTTVNISRSDH